MKLEDLKKEYDKLQVKYGAKELDSIYNGGCENNPDICFVFMNPTGRNVASLKTWTGRKSPWIGTKNIWRLFKEVNLISNDTFEKIQSRKPKDWDYEFSDFVYEELINNIIQNNEMIESKFTYKQRNIIALYEKLESYSEIQHKYPNISKSGISRKITSSNYLLTLHNKKMINKLLSSYEKELSLREI